MEHGDYSAYHSPSHLSHVQNNVAYSNTLKSLNPLAHQLEVPNVIIKTPKSDMEDDSEDDLSQGKFLSTC